MNVEEAVDNLLNELQESTKNIKMAVHSPELQLPTAGCVAGLVGNLLQKINALTAQVMVQSLTIDYLKNKLPEFELSEMAEAIAATLTHEAAKIKTAREQAAKPKILGAPPKNGIYRG